MSEKREPRPLQSPGYAQQFLREGETMPQLPTADVIAQYARSRRPEGTPSLFPIARLQRRSHVAQELPSQLLPDHTLLEVVPESMWAFPTLWRTHDATQEASIGLRERQAQEQDGIRRFLFAEGHRDAARQASLQSLDAYMQYARQVDPETPEGKAIALAQLINDVADNNPEAVDRLRNMIKSVAGHVPGVVMTILGRLGTGISLPGGKELLAIPAAGQLSTLVDTIPDDHAVVVRAMDTIQSAIQAGRDAIVAGQPEHVMHETELRTHPERHRRELAGRNLVKIAAALAPFAVTYGAAVVLPPVEGTVARVVESILGKKLLDVLRDKSGAIVDVVGSIVSDRLSGKNVHTREAIAVMELLLDVAGVDVKGIGEPLATHVYAQWGLRHQEEFIAANETVVLDQPYREALYKDQEAMNAVVRGKLRRARRIAGA